MRCSSSGVSYGPSGRYVQLPGSREAAWSATGSAATSTGRSITCAPRSVTGPGRSAGTHSRVSPTGRSISITERSLCYIGIVMSRREERREETRAELVEAAARVFARRGFHGASIDQIAREAGYSTGAIYWHFEGKDDLFLAVYEAYTAARLREWGEVQARAEGDLPRRARAYADQWMERLRADPDFLVLSLEFLVHAWRNPPLRE